MNRALLVFAGVSTVYSGALTYMLYDTKEKLIKKEHEFNTQLGQLQSTVKLIKEDLLILELEHPNTMYSILK